MPRYIDADALILKLKTQDYSGAPDTLEDWTPEDMTRAEIADIEHAPTADVVERKDLISILRGIVADLNKEMDECLEREEFASRFYLKAKRSMVEHLISIFEEANDG